MLSPILFTIYIDDLLHQLEQSGVGCYWGHQFVGAVCYADDLALLAPSPSALRLMLKTCTLFAETHSLFFKGIVSLYIPLINPRSPTFRMKLGRGQRSKVDSTVYPNACGDESCKPWPWRSSSSRQRC